MYNNKFDFVLVHTLHNYTGDDMLRAVFMPQCIAVVLEYHLFDDHEARKCCTCILLFCFYRAMQLC